LFSFVTPSGLGRPEQQRRISWQNDYPRLKLRASWPGIQQTKGVSVGRRMSKRRSFANQSWTRGIAFTRHFQITNEQTFALPRRQLSRFAIVQGRLVSSKLYAMPKPNVKMMLS
jgi:hypothetical protein